MYYCIAKFNRDKIFCISYKTIRGFEPRPLEEVFVGTVKDFEIRISRYQPAKRRIAIKTARFDEI